MPVSYTFFPHETYLEVSVSGVAETVRETSEYILAFREEALGRNLKKIFIDYRETIFKLDYHQMMELGDTETAADFHILGFRIATLVTPETYERHTGFDTIAANRSVVYKTFIEKDQAMDWLLK